MANDDFAILFAEKLDGFFADELVRSAVEAVFAHFVSVVYGIRNTVHIRFCGHSAMESRVEHRHHRHVGHNLSATLYASNVARHMKRSEFRILFANADNFVVDKHGLIEVLTAVKNSVSHCADFVRGFDCAVFGIDHCVQNKLDCLFVVFHIFLDIENSAVGRFWVSSPPSNVMRSQRPLSITCSVCISIS